MSYESNLCSTWVMWSISREVGFIKDNAQWETLDDQAWPWLERVLGATFGTDASCFMAQISSSSTCASGTTYYVGATS